MGKGSLERKDSSLTSVFHNDREELLLMMVTDRVWIMPGVESGTTTKD